MKTPNSNRPFSTKHIPGRVDRRIQRKLMYADLHKSFGKAFYTYGVKAAMPLIILIGVGYGLGFMDFTEGPVPVIAPEFQMADDFSDKLPSELETPEMLQLMPNDGNLESADTPAANMQRSMIRNESSATADISVTNETTTSQRQVIPSVAPAQKSPEPAENTDQGIPEPARMKMSNTVESYSSGAMDTMAIPAESMRIDPGYLPAEFPDEELAGAVNFAMDPEGSMSAIMADTAMSEIPEEQLQTCEAITEEIIVVADDGTESIETQTTYTCTGELPEEEKEEIEDEEGKEEFPPVE